MSTHLIIAIILTLFAFLILTVRITRQMRLDNEYKRSLKNPFQQEVEPYNTKEK